MIHYNQNQSTVQAVLESIHRNGSSLAQFVQANVTQVDYASRVMNVVVQVYGQLDV
jgi:hypothetical protein